MTIDERLIENACLAMYKAQSFLEAIGRIDPASRRYPGYATSLQELKDAREALFKAVVDENLGVET